MDKARLKEKAAKYDILLSETQLDLCAEYAKLIVEWNKKINITAIIDAEGMENKHFIDSMLLAVQAEIQGHVADVGTGAGFPGIVLKICKPDIELTLIESNNKKIGFLQHVSSSLGLNAAFLNMRAEDVAKSSYRESFDVVTARAVSALPMLSELCMPLVKKNGWFIPMKGRNNDEFLSAKNAISLLGGMCKQEKSYELPDESQRSLYFIQKIQSTNAKYPRHMGKIKKSPL